MNELINTLSYKDNPLHIFSYNGKTAFLTKEVADIGRTINELIWEWNCLEGEL